MRRTLLLLTVLLALLGSGALLAAPAAPAPQTADLAQLRQAIFQPAAALSPLAEALPMALTQCEPTRNVCVNKECQCGVLCGSGFQAQALSRERGGGSKLPRSVRRVDRLAGSRRVRDLHRGK